MKKILFFTLVACALQFPAHAQKQSYKKKLAELEERLRLQPCYISNFELSGIDSNSIGIIDTILGKGQNSWPVQEVARKKVNEFPNIIDDVLPALADKARNNELVNMPKEELVEQLAIVWAYFDKQGVRTSFNYCDEMSESERKKTIKELSDAYKKYKHYIPPLFGRLNEMYQFPMFDKYERDARNCAVNAEYIECVEKQKEEWNEYMIKRLNAKIKNLKQERDYY